LVHAGGLIACHDCDLLNREAEVPEGGSLRCARCGAVLYRNKRDSLDRTLALVFAATALFTVANVLPFLSFEMSGNVTETTLITGVDRLWDQGWYLLAGVVFLTAIGAPAIQIGLLLYVLVPLKLGRVPWELARIYRFLEHIQPWSMMEIFLIGILVSLVKLVGMADIVPGIAIWSFGLLIVVMAGVTAALDPRIVWDRVGVPA
jgi:paraquat-inducible protein A